MYRTVACKWLSLSWTLWLSHKIMLNMLKFMTLISSNILTIIIQRIVNWLIHLISIRTLLFCIRHQFLHLISLVQLLINITLLTISLAINYLFLCKKFVSYHLEVAHVAIILIRYFVLILKNRYLLLLQVCGRILITD